MLWNVLILIPAIEYDGHFLSSIMLAITQIDANFPIIFLGAPLHPPPKKTICTLYKSLLFVLSYFPLPILRKLKAVEERVTRTPVILHECIFGLLLFFLDFLAYVRKIKYKIRDHSSSDILPFLVKLYCMKNKRLYNEIESFDKNRF